MSFADFKKIKKKAKITKPEVIFPIPKNLNKCITNMYVNQTTNPVTPVIKVDAPSGYGLDNRFMFALNKFENFKRPCGGGNVEACENVKRVILDWAKADAAQRKGPSDHEAKHWNDTLTVNLWIASPMMAGFTFVSLEFGTPGLPDCAFSKISEPEEPQTVPFCHLSGGLKNHRETRLETRLGPRGGPSDSMISIFL